MGTDPKGSGNSTEFGFSFEDHGWRWDLTAFKHGSDVIRLELLEKESVFDQKGI